MSILINVTPIYHLHLKCQIRLEAHLYSNNTGSIVNYLFAYNCYTSKRKLVITVRNSNCGKVMFSQACVKNSVRGMHGRVGNAWRVGVCMAGGHAWQDRRPLQGTVHILLECILVFQFISVADPGFSRGRGTNP